MRQAVPRTAVRATSQALDLSGPVPVLGILIELSPLECVDKVINARGQAHARVVGLRTSHALVMDVVISVPDTELARFEEIATPARDESFLRAAQRLVTELGREAELTAGADEMIAAVH